MADNVLLPATGTGTASVTQATDDVSSVHYPIVKLADGTADATTVIKAAGGVEANALRVTVASDSTGVLTVKQATAGNLNMTEASASAIKTSVELMDDAVYIDDTSTHATGTSKGLLMMAAATPTDTAVNANDIGAIGMTLNRAQFVSVQDPVGNGTNAAALRVTMANDSTGILATVSTVTAVTSITNVVHVDDNSGSLTVDAPVGTPLFCTPTPSTTGGWSKWSTAKNASSNAPLTNAVQTVKGSAGTFGGYMVYNPNATAAYLQIFDSASASAGTTKADLIIAIPPTSAANIELTNGVNMATGIQVLATTTATGSTALATAGLDLTVWYK